MPRFEIRDPEGPPARIEREGKPHELVIVTYESPDGKTRHSSVFPLTDADIVQLAAVVMSRVLLMNDAPF